MFLRATVEGTDLGEPDPARIGGRRLVPASRVSGRRGRWRPRPRAPPRRKSIRVPSSAARPRRPAPRGCRGAPVMAGGPNPERCLRPAPHIWALERGEPSLADRLVGRRRGRGAPASVACVPAISSRRQSRRGMTRWRPTSPASGGAGAALVPVGLRPAFHRRHDGGGKDNDHDDAGADNGAGALTRGRGSVARAPPRRAGGSRPPSGGGRDRLRDRRWSDDGDLVRARLSHPRDVPLGIVAEPSDRARAGGDHSSRMETRDRFGVVGPAFCWCNRVKAVMQSVARRGRDVGESGCVQRRKPRLGAWIHGAARHAGRPGMPLRPARRPAGVPWRPSGRPLAVPVEARAGEILTRIVRGAAARHGVVVALRRTDAAFRTPNEGAASIAGPNCRSPGLPSCAVCLPAPRTPASRGGLPASARPRPVGPPATR